jgi:hypothetical protein
MRKLYQEQAEKRLLSILGLLSTLSPGLLSTLGSQVRKIIATLMSEVLKVAIAVCQAKCRIVETNL